MKNYKKCPNCGIKKSVEAFNKNKSLKDGFSCWCRECNRKYYRDHKDDYEYKEKRRISAEKWRIANKDRVNKTNREYIKRTKKRQSKLRVKRYRNKKIKAINYLGNKCLDCGIKYNGKNACIFQFHHRNPNEKDSGLPTLLRMFSWYKLKPELDKCDLLCANCHFMRHNNF